MNSPVKIEPPLETKMAQSKATAPDSSVWVSANAGSGKTYVLARRVIRLMLEGTEPSKILCLTFTKAAAAEMSNRVFELLGNWTALEDEALGAQINEITQQTPTRKQLERARKLFTMALDTPGGLKIQTIHAFCGALLHQFPLEANIPANFRQIEEAEQKGLLADAQSNIVLASIGKGSLGLNSTKRLANAFEIVRNYASESSIETALSEIISKRNELSNWLSDDIDENMTSLWSQFGLTRSDELESFCEKFNTESLFSDPDLKEIQIAGYQFNENQNPYKISQKIEELFGQTSLSDRFNSRLNLFLTKDFKPSKQFGSKRFTDDLGIREKFVAEQELLLKQFDKIKTFECLKASESIFIIAKSILTEYETLKRRRGLLDFNDLIQKSVLLLTRTNIHAWIQYKLDRGIDHVLVDEAQDTSRLQWQIINAITEEFFAGNGVSEKERTIFIVGDEKQSIYSFQGADPAEFDDQRQALEKKSAGIDKKLEPVTLNLSFRSTREILSAVDQVFSIAENQSGFNLWDTSTSHTTIRNGRGEVILWPLVEKPEKQKKEHWLTSLDERGQEAETILANRIALEIKGWIESEEKLPSRDRPIREGDILILLRKRGRFANAMNRALKQQGLATAGADRLKLTEHIISEDLTAIGSFATMQIDDLSLASILKCPLFEFTEDELFDLCYDRETNSLYEHLKNCHFENEVLQAKLEAAQNILKSILKSAERVPVFEFYSAIFVKYDLRKKYLSRLGSEAEDIIDGFLQAAIEHDSNLGTGLADFIEWLEESEPELKREIDMKSNEVRVITAHSSKGLEAPIVFLVDPGSKIVDTKQLPKIASLSAQSEKKSYIWQPTKDKNILASQPFYENEIDAAGGEYKRLLYVGMTRAEDRLIICGYHNPNDKHDHWYKMVETGLKAEPIDSRDQGRLETVERRDGQFSRYWKLENENKKEVKEKPRTEATSVVGEVPSWLFKKVENEAPLARPLTPSGVLNLLDIESEKSTNTFAPDKDGASALEYGNTVHALLQAVPMVGKEKYETVIEKYFENFGETLNSEQRQKAKLEILNLMAHPDSTMLFGENSKSEVSLNGRVKLGKKEHIIHGQIDRLVEEDEQIILADFKTNFSPPKQVVDIPSAYLAQLGLYRLLLREVYPNRLIKTYLVWTSSTDIMQVPDDLMDQQLAKLN